MGGSNLKKSNKVLIVILALVVLLVAFFKQISSYLIDFQWFKELGYTEIFFKKLVTQVEFFVPTFIILTIVFWGFFKFLNIHYAKIRVVMPDKKEKKLWNRIFIGISLVLSLFFSLVFVSSVWNDFLMFVNQIPFNLTDPLFGRDIAFYVFTIPFVTKVHSFLLGIVVLFAIITVVFNLISFATVNEVNQGTNDSNIRPIMNSKTVYWSVLGSASRQLAILGAAFLLLLAVGFILKSFDLLYSPRGVAYGASYTDVHVTLPFYYVFAALSGISALVLLVMNNRKNFKIMLAGPALLIVALVLSGVVSSIVQTYIVNPNGRSLEMKYLQNNIDYTNFAYALDKVDVKQFNVSQTLTRADIDANKTTISNIPINDYRPAKDIYNQIQGLKNYYTFSDVDLDRYLINGVYKQVMMAARELKSENVPGQTQAGTSWINRYLKYTHGYGVVMSPITEVTSSGQPRLYVKDMPIKSEIDLKIDKPQIYFGELTKDFALVKTKEKEFDYPDSDKTVETVYTGNGGIPMTFLNKLMFAVYEGNMNFLLSNDLTNESRVLINRDIENRVKKLVPFLSLDEDPYIVTTGGKLYWIIDAYTYSNRYPYSEPINANSDTNYIRNSVKVVIDAYEGSVNFYISDTKDPLIQTYANIFKTVFKPLADMPEGLKAHVRYPQKIFDIQTSIFTKYHMKNAGDLYDKADVWDIATQISGASADANTAQEVESTYLIMKLPQEKKEEFILMVPYTSQGKTNMISWFGVQCDDDNYGKLILYKFPAGKIIEGPMQVDGIVSQDSIIGPQLNLLETGGNSTVLRGNMMPIPLNDSLIYVEPVYIKARNANALPEVKKVIVFYKSQVVMEDSLDAALNKIFPTKGTTNGNTTPGNGTSTPGGTETPNKQLTAKELAKRASVVYLDAQTALKAGNWAMYGQKITELGDLLKQLEALTK